MAFVADAKAYGRPRIVVGGRNSLPKRHCIVVFDLILDGRHNERVWPGLERDLAGCGIEDGVFEFECFNTTETVSATVSVVGIEVGDEVGQVTIKILHRHSR